MNKPIRNILCYSHYDFDKIMENNKWIDQPPRGVSAISICSPNEDDLAEHWFKKDHKNGLTGARVFNLDIDDISPFWFKNKESYCYDNALELYLDNKVKWSNMYFSHIYITGLNNEYIDVLHALDYEEAFDLAKWIDFRIKYDETIYIHCAVGASRSQGVVRYIVDTYKYDYDIRLNPNNPNNTYNPHVLMMLKRAYMNSDFYSCITRDDEHDYLNYTESMKFNENVKLNLL
jgi:hypothetical protein